MRDQRTKGPRFFKDQGTKGPMILLDQGTKGPKTLDLRPKGQRTKEPKTLRTKAQGTKGPKGKGTMAELLLKWVIFMCICMMIGLGFSTKLYDGRAKVYKLTMFYTRGSKVVDKLYLISGG